MGVTVTALQALLPDELCLSSLGLVLRRAQPTWVDRRRVWTGLRTADCIAAGWAGWMERRRSGTGLWATNEAHTHSPRVRIWAEFSHPKI